MRMNRLRPQANAARKRRNGKAATLYAVAAIALTAAIGGLAYFVVTTLQLSRPMAFSREGTIVRMSRDGACDQRVFDNNTGKISPTASVSCADTSKADAMRLDHFRESFKRR
jgi:hypothetical protein